MHLNFEAENRAALENRGVSQRQVAFEEAYEFAQIHSAIYVEVSAKTGANIQLVFQEHVQHVYSTLM